MLTLTVTGTAGARPWRVEAGSVLNAGWAGRDRAHVEAHIDEMRKLGVPPPTEVPIVFPVARAMLTQGTAIEIYSPESSGEVEYVLIAAPGRAVLTVGSDHTDRGVERLSIELSKRVCPNVLAVEAWEYADVADHEDALILRAWVREDGRWDLYQDAPVADLLPPSYWLDRLASRLPESGAAVLFSGTVPTVGGALRYGDGFRISLEDPRRGRTITHEYTTTLLANPLRPGPAA